MVGPWLCGLWERSRSVLDTFRSLGAFGPSRAAAEAAWESLETSRAAAEVAWQGLEASRAARRGRPDDS